MSYVARAYNEFFPNDLESCITKVSKTQRLLDEINYYKSIPDDLKLFFPRLVSGTTVKYSNSTDDHMLKLELYKYNNVAHYLLNGDFDEILWTNIFDSLFYVIERFKGYNSYANSNAQSEDSIAMYIEKTENEFKALKDNPLFNDLCTYEKLTINQQEYDNFSEVWKKLKPYILDKMCNRTSFNVIHGDCCFSNILCGFMEDKKPVLKFIDPRGGFGRKGIYGDSYYDLAKIAHSCEGGYEYFIYDKFKYEEHLGTISMSFDNDNNQKAQAIFEKNVADKQLDMLQIRILEGTIFIGMCARHYDSPLRQSAMYATGVKILNECASLI